MSIIILLLALLLIAGVITVVASDLLYAAIALAVTSVMLSLLMFKLDSPLAGIFELSVCAGLITVVFISAISLTRRLTPEEGSARVVSRARRFIWLPVLVVVTGVALALFVVPSELPRLAPSVSVLGVRELLWNFRRPDLIGQMLLILTGVFVVVVLFKPGETGK